MKNWLEKLQVFLFPDVISTLGLSALGLSILGVSILGVSILGTSVLFLINDTLGRFCIYL